MNPTIPRPLRALLLDLDGTLVDSLPALYQAYAAFLGAHGLQGTAAEFAEHNGPSLEQVVASLAQRHGLPGPLPELHALYLQSVSRSYPAGLRAMDGAAALLVGARANGCRLALVTGAARALAREMLARLGWEDHFDVLITGDEGYRGKPDPAPYCAALERLGCLAEEALAVDDAPAGVVSARRAGVTTIGMAHGTSAEALRAAGAAGIVNSPAELLALLKAPRAESDRVVVLHRGRVALRWSADSRPPDSCIVARVDRLWDEARGQPGSRLHDGTVLSLVARAGDTLTGCFRPYRYYHAQARAADLDAGVRPIGVSGLVSWEGPSGVEVLLARRAGWVTAHPGRIELVPSGSLDERVAAPDGTVRWEQRLLEELTEESGIDAARVAEVRPFLLVYDRHDRVLDVVAELAVHGSRNELLVGFSATQEYTDPILVPAAELGAFLDHGVADLAPATLVVARAWLAELSCR